MMFQEFHALEDTKNPRAAVLIVEDERISRRALALLLSASGYPTHAVGSAEEALKILKQGETPAIALVDLDLPGMNGLDLIGRLEQLDPAVFPVLITAAGSDALANTLRDRGVTYMRKPVDFDHLLTLLQEKPAAH